jgi:integrase
MARPATGTVVKRPTARGTSYSLRVSYRGERRMVYLGGAWEGWNDERAEAERDHVARMIERGEWVPPDVEPSHAPARPGAPPTYQVAASEYLERKRLRVATKTYDDLYWRLSCGIDHLGPHRVDRITEPLLEDMVQALLRERETIRAAAAGGAPIMETVIGRGGQPYERRRRGLSNNSINKAVAAVRKVLNDARKRWPDHVTRNPADDRELRVPVAPAARSFLEAHHIEALLDAARRIDANQPGLDWEKVNYIRTSDKSAVKLARELRVSDTLIGKVRRNLIWTTEPAGYRYQRRGIIATLVLAGPRISELCGLPEDHLDLPGGRILIPPRDMEHDGPQTKTFAGERVIPMVPALREIHISVRASQPASQPPSSSSRLAKRTAFSTRNGTPQTPGNITNRVLAPVLADAELLLAEREQTPMPHVTPHTLRRTFASILAETGVQPRRAMYLLGHTDPQMTLKVYQQVLDMSGSAVETLERVLGGSLDDVGEMLSGRDRRRRGGDQVPDVDRALNNLLEDR